MKEVNIYFDKSTTAKELHQVEATRAVTGRNSRYYVTFNELDEIRVPYSLYKQFHTNDFAIIYTKKGSSCVRDASVAFRKFSPLFK